MDSLQEVAYHEAGHAVAAWRMNAELVSVGARQGVGYATTRGPLGVTPSEFVRRSLLITFAGPEAQRIYAPQSDIEGDAIGDMEQARQTAGLILKLDSPEASMLVRMSQREARLFVNHEWQIIDALAVELIRLRELSGAACIAIMRAVDPTGSRGGWR